MSDSSAEIAAPRPSTYVLVGAVLVLYIPVTILVIVSWRFGPTPLLAGGIATEAFLAMGVLHQFGFARGTSHKTASPLYLTAVVIVWASAKQDDWVVHAIMGTLVGVPLTLFVGQEFLFSGAASQRRARSLVRRLLAKTNWPADLSACKLLPEVKALREALRENAEPVLVLLMNPMPQVRIAALASLEFRPTWRMGQAEAVLQAARFATEPPVRATAIMALANVDDSKLSALIAVYLRDLSPEVRKAAAEALLWDAANRWVLIRREIRHALSDPRCAGDGPLPMTSSLPAGAKNDLTMWSGESGPISKRSMQTLIAHFHREVNENPSQEVIDELAHNVRDRQVPSALRVAYAELLSDQDCVNEKLWGSLLEGSQPSYLRLLAAGALLKCGTKNDTALDTLREVASVPNREMALQVAAIVQKHLRVDMGLSLDGAMPEPQSKLAAEVARRVIDWSMGRSKLLPSERGGTRRPRISTVARQITKPPSERRI
jgi:hypothetical protein